MDFRKRIAFRNNLNPYFQLRMIAVRPAMKSEQNVYYFYHYEKLRGIVLADFWLIVGLL